VGYSARRHARAARNRGAELVAAVNWRLESLAIFVGEFGIARTYLALDELLQAGGTDSAIVGTPKALNAPQTSALLEAGIHVMVEKPMALDVAEAAQLRPAAARSGRALIIAHCWRFDAEVRLLRAYVAASDLGMIIRTRSGVHTHTRPSGRFTRRSLTGGTMADMGAHAIDTVRFLLGDP
jgi:predicted dehydrogenase